MSEQAGFYLPDRYTGKFILKPVQDLTESERCEYKKWWDTPKAISVRGDVFSDWSFLDFEHGRIYHVAQFLAQSGKLVGTRPEIVTKPAVVIIPMKVGKDEVPQFLNIAESRFFAFDLLKRPLDLYGKSRPFVEDFGTFPQGHARMQHSEITSEGPNNRFKGMESIIQAAFREMMEEARYKGTGWYKRLRMTYRDQSVSAAQITFILAEVAADEKQVQNGDRTDLKESVSAAMWATSDQIRRLRKKWIDLRAIGGSALIEDYLETDYLDPKKRFDGFFNTVTL